MAYLGMTQNLMRNITDSLSLLWFIKRFVIVYKIHIFSCTRDCSVIEFDSVVLWRKPKNYLHDLCVCEVYIKGFNY